MTGSLAILIAFVLTHPVLQFMEIISRLVLVGHKHKTPMVHIQEEIVIIITTMGIILLVIIIIWALVKLVMVKAFIEDAIKSKCKTVQQSVNVAVTSSGWYKGLPQKCETSVKQRFPFIEGFQRIVL